uniref:Tudor domain-containing protein 7 n=1 Tax=Lygus hesperus TaxID=30085 RepID=A0A0K8TEH4_LYGHE
MASEKDKVISNLRACLISSPGGTTVSDLNKDYRSLVGENIPFRRLGYSSLEEFLQFLPNVDIVNRGGQNHVIAKVAADSSHIAKLVQGQKKTSKKPRKAKFSTSRFSSRPPPPRHFGSSNQVPHFMQGSSHRKAPPPRPQAQYIAVPGPVKTYPTNAPKSSPKPLFPTGNQSKTTKYVAPQDLPVTTYPTKTQRPISPQPALQNTSKPTLQNQSQPELQNQFNPALKNQSKSAFQNQSKPAKYEAPEDIPEITTNFPTSTVGAPANLLPTPRTPANPWKPNVPQVERSAPPSRPPLLPTPTTPTEPWKHPPIQKPRTSVADRLNVYKNKNNLTSISEVQVPVTAHNGNSSNGPSSNGPSSNGPPDTNSYSLAVTHQSNNIPETFPCEVKVVDPISWNKDKKNKEKSTDSQILQSPTKTFKNVNLQSYHYDENSYIFKLTRYVDKHNWPKPDFFVLNRRVGNPKCPENRYICRVSVNCTPIGTQSSSGSQVVPLYEFSSYPEEFPDVNAAMSYVAKKAYDALLEKDTIELPETEDVQIILGRISEMVKGKEQGVWLYQIEKMYKNQFNESLPKDLPSLMDQCPTLEISKLAESYYIVRPKQLESDSTKYFSPTYVSNLTVNKLTYPSDDSWDVFVSKVKSLNEVYIRVIGDQYSHVYETLATEMETYYLTQETEHPQSIEVGKYYALVNQDSCYRVLVTIINEDHCQVYLIDVGDVDNIETNLLRVLLPKIYVAASQAVPCFLDGLHNYDFPMTNPMISEAFYEMILAKSFVGVLSNRDPIHMTLYDTESSDDVNMNLALKQLIDESFVCPTLCEEGTLEEILVTTVDGNGQVFIQIPSWTLSCLNEKITLISNGYYVVTYLNDPSEVSSEKIYFWSNGPTRVKVLEVQLDGELVVDFIDTGGQKTVHLSELYEVELLNDLLTQIPPQAVPVLLHDVNDGTLKAYQVQKFLDMVNSNSVSPTIGKVVSFLDGIPQIEIFVRNEASNLLVSVNSNLSLSESMSCRASQMSIDKLDKCSTVSASTFSHVDGTFLKCSVAPKIGDELDIYVTGIANPLNFTITPVSHLKYLNQLGEDMIIFYSSTSTKEVHRPRVGEYVAAQSDGCWFRVEITKKLDSDFYSGKYLDHGHMDVFPLKAIRVLPEKFKKLPFLAFRAQLHGIRPVSKDWDVEDCLAVKAMIHNKKLFSLVRDIIYDDDGKKLSLEIIDTSTNDDIYVARQLVMENRALSTLR